MLVENFMKGHQSPRRCRVAQWVEQRRTGRTDATAGDANTQPTAVNGEPSDANNDSAPPCIPTPCEPPAEKVDIFTKLNIRPQMTKAESRNTAREGFEAIAKLPVDKQKHKKSLLRRALRALTLLEKPKPKLTKQTKAKPPNSEFRVSLPCKSASVCMS